MMMEEGMESKQLPRGECNMTDVRPLQINYLFLILPPRQKNRRAGGTRSAN